MVSYGFYNYEKWPVVRNWLDKGAGGHEEYPWFL